MQPDIILWTGDSASHNMIKMTEEKLIETI